MGKRRSTLIAFVLLLCMLGIAAALAYQAQNAARSHRTTAENVIRDYAGFASWEFSRIARRDLTDTVGSMLARIGCYSASPLNLAHLKIEGG